MRAAEVLEKAIEKIETRGWQQGMFGDEHRGYCLMGAINESVCGKSWKRVDEHVLFGERAPAVGKIKDVLRVTPTCSFPDEIVYWNDHPRRTKEEVLEVLYKAKAIS